MATRTAAPSAAAQRTARPLPARAGRRAEWAVPRAGCTPTPEVTGLHRALLRLQAAECAVRMFKAGAKNHEITAMIAKARCNHSSATLQL